MTEKWFNRKFENNGIHYNIFTIYYDNAMHNST